MWGTRLHARALSSHITKSAATSASNQDALVEPFVAPAGDGEGERGDLRDTNQATQSRALTYGK